MPLFPAVTRNRRRFIRHILEKNPDLDVTDRNYIVSRILLSLHEGHYLEDMILANNMTFRVLLHEIFHHILWKLKYPMCFHNMLDKLDIVMRRKWMQIK